MSGLRGDLSRKLLHIAMGGFAFLLRYLTWWQAALLAIVALLNNLLVMPRVGRKRFFRGEAKERGLDVGIVLYAASVLVLILVFPHRLDLVAAAWAFLAFGDGLATIAGLAFGRASGPLPWNAQKTWAGFTGFVVAGVPMALALFAWTGGWAITPAIALKFLAVGLVLAVLESLDTGINDNARLPWALGLNLAAAGLAYALKTVDLSGVAHGVLLGSTIWLCLGGPGFAILLAFFVLGSAATKVGYRTKAKEGTAQEKGGRRGAAHAWANTGAPALFAALAFGAAQGNGLFRLAFVAALATAVSDTLGSEIGQAFGRRTFLITTFRPVPRGTDGAVSLEGTLAGIAGSLLLGLLGWGLGLIDGAGVAIVVAAAFVGTTLESYLGAVLEQASLINNEAQNFLNTLAGGLAAILIAWLAG
ncbi:MAG: TIGR00297 family protein [Acidobacteria bacterium]|nr:TIGR00297 family protein [Acidobacteriota bacterium]